MLYNISNDYMKVTVNSFGASLHEISSNTGKNFLYDGNPKYWNQRDINIFPYIARLYDEKYYYNGNLYHLEIHGFLWKSEFEVEKKGQDYIVFSLRSNKETLLEYPFEFNFKIKYFLSRNVISKCFEVENNDTKCMIFGIGGHPAFKVPIDDNLKFEDYYLEFSEKSIPTRVGMSDDCYVTGNDKVYKLDERKIYLRHEIFDDDAIILKNVSREVTIKSDKSSAAIRVTYPDMSVLGIWHMPKTDAPYVCIEPWTSLSGRKDIVEVLNTQSDLIHLPAGKVYSNEWFISIYE